MKKILTPILLLFIAATPFAQNKNYNSNGKIKIVSEKTYLKISTVNKDISTFKQAAAAALGAILPPLIDLGNSVVKSIVKGSAKKYQGQYKAFNSESGFYQTKDLINLPKLELTRKIKRKSGEEETAVVIILMPEVSRDMAAFRYKVTSVTYNYAIAKTKGDWDYIDATMELKFKSVGINKGQYEVKDLRGTNIFIPMIKVGSAYTLDDNMPIYSGWIPFPPVSIVEAEVLQKTEEKKSVESEKSKGDKAEPKELINEVTKTQQKAKEALSISDNVGMYEIEVLVTETNPYKIKAENKQQLIENSSDKAVDFLKALVGLTQKKESKDSNEETDNH